MASDPHTTSVPITTPTRFQRSTVITGRTNATARHAWSTMWASLMESASMIGIILVTDSAPTGAISVELLDSTTPRQAAPQGVPASPAASPAPTAPLLARRHHGPSLPTRSSAGGLRRWLGRRTTRAYCQTVGGSLEPKSLPESTVNIVDELALEAPCLRSVAIWHRHNGPRQARIPPGSALATKALRNMAARANLKAVLSRSLADTRAGWPR